MKLGLAVGYWGLGLSSEDQLRALDAVRAMLQLSPGAREHVGEL